MGKFIDLTGRIFTHLTVLQRVPNKGKRTMWLCRCICGKQKTIGGNDLRHNKTKGCGSFCSYEPRKRIEGKKYGRLTVLRLIAGERSAGQDSRSLWEVRCECGMLLRTTLHALNPGKKRTGLTQCSECSKQAAENRLVGKVFYYLTVVSFHEQDPWGGYKWKCLCRCGNISYVTTSSLERAATKSCGCYTKERLRKNGKSKTPLYRVWNHARRRCSLSSDKAYKRYGGRGILMCQEWLENFDLFEAWALQNGYQQGLQLDRIDVNKSYSPENCQFISKNCNSAFAWIDKMTEIELRQTEHRIALRRNMLTNPK